MINIAVLGANGRVGQALTSLVESDKDKHYRLVIKLNSSSEKSALLDLGSSIDVLIDFSRPEATMHYLEQAVLKHIPMVIGTTGFSEAQKAIIAQCAKDIPIVMSPNMSIGMNVCFKLLAMAAATLENQAEIGIVEVHRKNKIDSPSGTALKLKEIIQTSRNGSSSNRDHLKPVEIASLRMGDVVGDHSVLFELIGEKLELTHSAVDRSLFASGALRASQWVVKQPAGLYDMQQVLGIVATDN